MTRPTAIIDKSLLHEIAAQSPAVRDLEFNALIDRFDLVVPLVLVEEVWVNLANPGDKSQVVVETMAAMLLHLHQTWIAEPLEVAFVELVRQQPVEIIPKPAESVMRSFFTLRKDDEALAKWVRDRKTLTESIVRQRVQEHATILKPEAFSAVKNEREFFDRLIFPKFTQMLAVPERKRKLLEGVLGLAFRMRDPESSAQIDAAFESYSLETYGRFHVTSNCIMTAMFYYYAPLCKIVSAEGEEPLKILGRSRKAQGSNVHDERYVQSALLCERLLTRDKAMRNMMSLFKAAGLWNGECVFFEPGTSILAELQKRF